MNRKPIGRTPLIAIPCDTTSENVGSREGGRAPWSVNNFYDLSPARRFKVLNDDARRRDRKIKRVEPYVTRF